MLMDDEMMDIVTENLIHKLQTAFPLVEAPYGQIAAELGVDEEIVLVRVQDLLDQGILRRIGCSFVAQKAGHETTLAAAFVAPLDFSAAVDRINAYDEVTHHYLRDDDQFNLWFTLVAPGRPRIRNILAELTEVKGIERLQEFPAQEVFKLNAGFDPRRPEAE